MAERVLRDQCEHGRYEEHSVMWTDNRTTSSYTSPCPGGREVTAAEIQELAYSLWQAEQMDEYHRDVL